MEQQHMMKGYEVCAVASRLLGGLSFSIRPLIA